MAKERGPASDASACSGAAGSAAMGSMGASAYLSTMVPIADKAQLVMAAAINPDLWQSQAVDPTGTAVCKPLSEISSAAMNPPLASAELGAGAEAAHAHAALASLASACCEARAPNSMSQGEESTA